MAEEHSTKNTGAPSERAIGRRRIRFSWQYFDPRKSSPEPDARTMTTIKNKLAAYEQLTLSEFRHHNGALLRSAQTFRKLYKPAALFEEIEAEPLYFRVGRKGRVFGFRRDEVFYITQLDMQHKMK